MTGVTALDRDLMERCDRRGVTSRHPILTSREMPGWGDPPQVDWVEQA